MLNSALEIICIKQKKCFLYYCVRITCPVDVYSKEFTAYLHVYVLLHHTTDCHVAFIRVRFRGCSQSKSDFIQQLCIAKYLDYKCFVHTDCYYFGWQIMNCE